MIVREAYRDVTHRVCRDHYATVTDVSLGPIQDARDHGCEWCESESAQGQHPQITIEGIRALRAEASAAGDSDLVNTCDSALLDGSEGAWRECERVIRDARAQRGE